MEILTRLPVNSVLRFRSVCKLWNTLFSDPEFIKYHLKYISQNLDNDSLIISTYVNGRMLKYYSEIAILSSSKLLETRLSDFTCSKPASSHANISWVAGSSNGLVCISLPELKQFILWNPAIRQAMKIDSPIIDFLDVYAILCAFCWDAIENDFKVVSSYRHKNKRGYSLYIYSCNSGTWSLLPNFTLAARLPYFMVPSVIVNEIPYFKHDSFCEKKVRMIKFEIGSKEFRELPDLDVPRYQDRLYCTIAVNLKECLSVLAYTAGSSNSLVDVYSFDERCGVWSTKYNVGPISSPVETLLGCFKYGGEFVFTVGGKYKCYDHSTKKIRDLGYQHRYGHNICISYKASLVFIEGMKLQYQVDSMFLK